jgi:hypothetical protein
MGRKQFKIQNLGRGCEEWGECVEALCAASRDDNEGRFNFSYHTNLM